MCPCCTGAAFGESGGLRDACGEHGSEAGEVGHGGHEGDLHADLCLAEEAGEASSEPSHASDLPLDHEALSTVVPVGFGLGIPARVEEEVLVWPDLHGLGRVLG